MASQELDLDFGAGQASGLEELAGAAPVFVNLLVSADKSIRVRPLVEEWDDFATTTDGNPVVGMFSWRDYLIFVTQDNATGIRYLWAWLGPGNVVALSDTTSATQLNGTGRPVWSFDSERVVVVGGGATMKWEGIGLASVLGGSPPNFSHIGYAATRFIGNDPGASGIIYWTPPGVGNHETWNTDLDFAEAEASPDPAVALHVDQGEVFVWGGSTTQVYVPDPAVSFSTTATALSTGCGAAYSIIPLDKGFAWLDARRRVVASDARALEVISSPLMTKSLETLGTISDCWGSRIRIGAYDILLWVFPTEGRAIYYEQISKKWGEWRSWDGVDWLPWIGRSYFYWPDRNLHLVGLEDGTIGVLSLEATTELGETVKAVSRTGFRDCGTKRRKHSAQLQVTMKRGATSTTAAIIPEVEISYRDDLGDFSMPMGFSLGAGDYAPTISRWGLGMYRERQYQLQFSGAAEFVLTSATETVETAES